MRIAIMALVVIGIGVVVFTDVPAAYVFGPLLGLVIFRFGMSTFGALRQGGAHIPDGPPEPVDTRVERTVYWCSGCGAEMLLTVKGTDVPPRHCGERMTVRHEEPSNRAELN